MKLCIPGSFSPQNAGMAGSVRTICSIRSTLIARELAAFRDRTRWVLTSAKIDRFAVTSMDVSRISSGLIESAMILALIMDGLQNYRAGGCHRRSRRPKTDLPET